MWSNIDMRAAIELAQTIATRMSYTYRKWRDDSNYGGGDYGDLAEAQSAANESLALILSVPPPTDYELSGYVAIRVSRSIKLAWRRGHLRRRQLELPPDGADVGFVDMMNDRLDMIGLAEVLGPKRLAALLSGAGGAGYIYMPNGAKLLCPRPCQANRAREKLEAAQRALGFETARNDTMAKSQEKLALAPVAPTKDWCGWLCAAPGCRVSRTNGQAMCGPVRAMRKFHYIKEQGMRWRCWGTSTPNAEEIGSSEIEKTHDAVCVDGFSELSDWQWERLEPIIVELTDVRTRKLDLRQAINGIRWALFFEMPWSSVPKLYGNGTFCAQLYKRLKITPAWVTIRKLSGEIQDREASAFSSMALCARDPRHRGTKQPEMRT